jgi:pimeloyl-ACP methyl ester carboxylesterase
VLSLGVVLDEFPIIYIRGYAGSTSGIDVQVDDPFYGFNKGATHVRVGGGGDPMYYQFEGPLLRLITEHGYALLVHGDQRHLLDGTGEKLPAASIWVHRFYDNAATTFVAPRREKWFERIGDKIHQSVTSDGFDIEQAAADLYDLIERVLLRTEAPRVNLVAHSMGGLVARCMMQKICRTPRTAPEGSTSDRRPAREIVDKLFTFGTPHGGIATELGAVNKAMEIFGPAGSDIFSPPKMYGYLTPGAKFGDLPPKPESWDPRDIPGDVFDVDDVFCIVGTDPGDYGPSRIVVGPRSDGLVRIENAYVKGAHRAYIYKSHSGSYGEVNSEEGYQNLRRFLFGRWAVSLSFSGLPDQSVLTPGVTWQADMRLSVRGLPVIMSEQQAAHWCPIILNEEVTQQRDTTDAPIPIVSTFLLQREPPTPDQPLAAGDQLSRYVVTLRVFKLVQTGGAFDFRDHLEQVSEWADSLIVDVGPAGTGAGLGAWTAWNADVLSALDAVPRMPNQLTLERDAASGRLVGTVELPDTARSLPIFGEHANLRITVTDRNSARLVTDTTAAVGADAGQP